MTSDALLEAAEQRISVVWDHPASLNRVVGAAAQGFVSAASEPSDIASMWAALRRRWLMAATQLLVAAPRPDTAKRLVVVTKLADAFAAVLSCDERGASASVDEVEMLHLSKVLATPGLQDPSTLAQRLDSLLALLPNRVGRQLAERLLVSCASALTNAPAVGEPTSDALAPPEWPTAGIALLSAARGAGFAASTLIAVEQCFAVTPLVQSLRRSAWKALDSVPPTPPVLELERVVRTVCTAWREATETLSRAEVPPLYLRSLRLLVFASFLRTACVHPSGQRKIAGVASAVELWGRFAASRLSSADGDDDTPTIPDELLVLLRARSDSELGLRDPIGRLRGDSGLVEALVAAECDKDAYAAALIHAVSVDALQRFLSGDRASVPKRLEALHSTGWVAVVPTTVTHVRQIWKDYLGAAAVTRQMGHILLAREGSWPMAVRQWSTLPAHQQLRPPFNNAALVNEVVLQPDALQQAVSCMRTLMEAMLPKFSALSVIMDGVACGVGEAPMRRFRWCMGLVTLHVSVSGAPPCPATLLELCLAVCHAVLHGKQSARHPTLHELVSLAAAAWVGAAKWHHFPLRHTIVSGTQSGGPSRVGDPPNVAADPGVIVDEGPCGDPTAMRLALQCLVDRRGAVVQADNTVSVDLHAAVPEQLPLPRHRPLSLAAVKDIAAKSKASRKADNIRREALLVGILKRRSGWTSTQALHQLLPQGGENNEIATATALSNLAERGYCERRCEEEGSGVEEWLYTP